MCVVDMQKTIGIFPGTQHGLFPSKIFCGKLPTRFFLLNKQDASTFLIASSYYYYHRHPYFSFKLLRAYSRTLLLSCIRVDNKAAKNVSATVITAGNSKIEWTKAL